MNRREFYRFAGLMLILLLLEACGGDETPTPTNTPTAVPPTPSATAPPATPTPTAVPPTPTATSLAPTSTAASGPIVATAPPAVDVPTVPPVDAPTSLPAEQPTGIAPTGAPASAADFAVCDAYQHLVDVWPGSAGQLTGSPQDVYKAIEEAGAGLMTAGPGASNPELAQLGEGVGAAAVNFVQLDEATRQTGFVPFFDESLIGGRGLRQLCQEMGRAISTP